MSPVLWQSDLPGFGPPRRGKVRDVYDLGDALLIVATDRLSAYDFVLQPGIPDKGRILNQLSNFWFEKLAGVVPNHLLATEPEGFPAGLAPYRDLLRGRAVLVRRAKVVPFECVARGYLAGSGYREYRATGEVCGIRLPTGLDLASPLPEPIFTPATKAAEGHDLNVDLAAMETEIGAELAARLRGLTLEIYRQGASWVAEKDLILADTKLEFGFADDGQLLLVDEVMTPDSSRYWDVHRWQPGEEPASFDKQYVRNWLDTSGWDHHSPPPVLPEEVVRGTRERYIEAFRRITGREPTL